MTIETDLTWLLDRARISDLLFSFANSLDQRNWAAYQNNYADGGTIELPISTSTAGETFILRKEDMLKEVPAGLGGYSGTQHISTNHQITVQGDRATSRSYCLAVHVAEQQTDHWSIGGWYDAEYIRTPDGWKFQTIKFKQVWLAGEVRANNP